MFDLKTRALLYHTTSNKREIYKRRIMVGDVLANKTLYADFPDNFVNMTDLSDGSDQDRGICRFNNSDTYASAPRRICEYTDRTNEYGIYIGPSVLENSIYFYNLETNKLEVNKNKYKMSYKVQDVTEVTDCQAYRHIYIEDPNIRPLKVGDALKNGTKLYFNIPDNITKLYSAYKYPVNTKSIKSKVRSKAPILRAPSTPNPTTDTLISRFLNVTYHPDELESTAPIINLILTDGSSNIDIFKADFYQSTDYKPEINISSYLITSPTIITEYNEFDFWSQFILVDETTLSNIRPLREDDVVKTGTQLFFNFPDSFFKDYITKRNSYGNTPKGKQEVIYDSKSNFYIMFNDWGDESGTSTNILNKAAKQIIIKDDSNDYNIIWEYDTTTYDHWTTKTSFYSINLDTSGPVKLSINPIILTDENSTDRGEEEFDITKYILVNTSTLANSSDTSEFSYRAPEFTDNLSGKVMKFNFPSTPISKISYNTRNNDYLVSTGANGGGYEAVMYDTTSQADDHSWDIQTFTAIVEVGGIRVYECVTTVKTTYDTSKGTQTSQVVQSVKENIKKEYIVLPSDFGTLISYGGSVFEIYPEIDDLSTTKRGYTLSTLTTSDKITSDGLLLLPQFPTNIDKVWFPTVPSANEYGHIDLGEAYTLFSVEKEYTAPGDEYPTSYAYSVQAIMSANGTYDDNSKFVADGTYNFMIMGSEMMQSNTVCAKQYGSDTTYQWNVPLRVPGFVTDILLSTLNTSSPLLQYMKKVTWL